MPSAKTAPKQRQLRSIYDEPPRLIIDPIVRASLGDSAYFQGGEYRKPDPRTIFTEGLERMYQKTLQPSFEDLPKETVEYQIKTADNYWYKFLDVHSELYNNCETIEGIEGHRVTQRQSQRTHELLMLNPLQRLANINAMERVAVDRGARPNRSSKGGNNNIQCKK